jgi:hypothetical protein
MNEFIARKLLKSFQVSIVEKDELIISEGEKGAVAFAVLYGSVHASERRMITPSP